MSFWDKIKCRACGHWRIRHTGTHVKGSRTACRDCRCPAFELPPP